MESGLLEEIKQLVQGGYTKDKRGPAIEIYRRAFPLPDIDLNCKGCILKVFGKLEEVAKKNELKVDTMATKKSKRYKWTGSNAGKLVSLPKVGVFNLAEEDITPAIAERIVNKGYGTFIEEVKEAKPE